MRYDYINKCCYVIALQDIDQGTSLPEGMTYGGEHWGKHREVTFGSKVGFIGPNGTNPAFF